MGAVFLIAGTVTGQEECSKSLLFNPGERLAYRIIYMAAPAGTAVLNVNEMTEIDGVSVHHFTATARSAALFSLFYKVDDRVESFVDKKTFSPVRFEEHLREGPRYKKDKVTLFCQDRKIAKVGDKEISVPADVQDYLSSFYYLRVQPLEVGKSLFINVNAGEKNYNVEIKVLRKEKIKKWGKFVDTVVIQPVIRDVKMGGILKKKGEVLIWLTDDKKRIPLLIRAKVAIGHLNFVLMHCGTEFENEKGKH